MIHDLQVLETKDHKLHGRTIDPKPANPRQGIKKIFVGRLDPGVPEDDVKAYFAGFGTVSFTIILFGLKVTLLLGKTKHLC